MWSSYLSCCNELSLTFGTEECSLKSTADFIVKSTADFIVLSRFQASLVLSSMFLATPEGTAKSIEAWAWPSSDRLGRGDEALIYC